MNKCLFIGRLTRDPETKESRGGKPYCKLTLAVDRPKNPNGGGHETDFINMIAFDKKAEVITQYLAKGRLIQVDCVCRISKQDDGQGNQRTFTNFFVEQFEFLDSQKSQDGGQAGQARSNDQGASAEQRARQAPAETSWDPEDSWGGVDRPEGNPPPARAQSQQPTDSGQQGKSQGGWGDRGGSAGQRTTQNQTQGQQGQGQQGQGQQGQGQQGQGRSGWRRNSA